MVLVAAQARDQSTAILKRMLSKSAGTLAALLTLSVGCSGSTASTSTSRPVPNSVVATALPPPTATVATSTSPDSAVATADEPATTRVATGTSTTSAPKPIATDPHPAPTTSVATNPGNATNPGTELVNAECTAPGSNGFDLVHVRVESLPSRYRFIARYSGDALQHDILVSFDLAASTYLVTAELFEDGTGVPRLAGAGLSEDVFLDPPQTITPGLVDLSVRNDQLGGISETPFTVIISLKVDGSAIETCP